MPILPPPSSSFEVLASGSKLSLVSNGATVATITVSGGAKGSQGGVKRLYTVAGLQSPAKPVFLGYPHGPKTAEFVPPGRQAELHELKFHLSAGQTIEVRVFGTPDSFLCSASPLAPLTSVFGHHALSSADSVYSRDSDSLLSVDGATARSAGTGNTYRFTASGSPTIRFQPNYYRDTLGYFLWTRNKPLWPAPVMGWCSWAAYGQDVRESDVVEAAKFFSANLAEYGYKVIQLDDGYQRVLQHMDAVTPLSEKFSHYWTIPNDKFPHGMRSLAEQISGVGMTPGIWIGFYLPPTLHHSEGYVEGSDGKPLKGPWVDYAMNGFDVAARDEAYIDTIREFKAQGWNYFKIDTLRHVLYDNYRRVPDYWKARGQSMEEAYRALVAAAKTAAGSSYMMACWGTLPELAGLPDGARIGEDVGPDFDSMRRSAKYVAQFHYLNNVVWRNDPDYMCLRAPVEQARAWATFTSMAGGHVMVSDPISEYDPERVDILRRVGPTLFLRPGNVIPLMPDPEYVNMALSKGTEAWNVVARFGWKDEAEDSPELSRFGLDANRNYLAFDFWNEQFLGSVKGKAAFHALPKGSCQVIAFRHEEDHPQVLGTNRHIAQGEWELRDVKWSGSSLSGMFVPSAGRQWSVYLHVPPSWELRKSVGEGVQVSVMGEVVKLTFPDRPSPIRWKVTFARL